MILEKFIESKHFNNAWITWTAPISGVELYIYIRKGCKVIDEKVIKNVLDLVNIRSSIPGNGAFKELLNYLKFSYPKYTIHVENVISEKFAKGLKKLGFKKTTGVRCFVKQ